MEVTKTVCKHLLQQATITFHPLINDIDDSEYMVEKRVRGDHTQYLWHLTSLPQTNDIHETKRKSNQRDMIRAFRKQLHKKSDVITVLTHSIGAISQINYRHELTPNIEHFISVHEHYRLNVFACSPAIHAEFEAEGAS